MLTLLLATAEASVHAISPEAVGVIIAAIFGGGGFVAGRKAKPVQVQDPLNVSLSKTYVTRQEHDDDIRDLRNTLRDAESKTHRRLDAITILLNDINGQLKERRRNETKS